MIGMCQKRTQAFTIKRIVSRLEGIDSERQVNEKTQDFSTLRAVSGSPQTATWRLHRWDARVLRRQSTVRCVDADYLIGYR